MMLFKQSSIICGTFLSLAMCACTLGSADFDQTTSAGATGGATGTGGGGGGGTEIEEHGPPVTDITSAGAVCESPQSSMFFAIGEPTHIGAAASIKYKMEDGVIRMNGGLP